MPAYLIDTNLLSTLLNNGHPLQHKAREIIAGLDPNSEQFTSEISIGEIIFGANAGSHFHPALAPSLARVLANIPRDGRLPITSRTARAYGELKTSLAKLYQPQLNRKKRPPYLQDWIMQNEGKALQVGENDLWLCAQCKERDLVLVTADKKISRIAKADKEVVLHLIELYDTPPAEGRDEA